MRGPGFKQKKISLSISFVAYKQIENLSKQTGMMVSDYIRKLVIQHLVELGLPVYYDIDEIVERSEEKAEDAGQDQ